jgi:serine/threonine protein phosphatase PrpC
MACPACAYGDNLPGANFCENCGAPLTAQATDAVPDTSAAAVEAIQSSEPPAPSLPISAENAETVQLDLPAQDVSADWTCACGQINPASEDFCTDCGEARPPAVKPLAVGDLFAGYEIVAQSGPQTLSVRAIASDTPSAAATLLFGSPEQLDERRAVLQTLATGTIDEAASHHESQEGGAEVSRDAESGDANAAAGAGIAIGTEPQLAPRVLDSGSDPARGAYLMLDQPEGDWRSASQETRLDRSAAPAILRSLLLLAERAAAADRLILLSPAAILLQDDRLFMPLPVAPSLPLSEPLLADPAFVAPELRTGDRTADAWQANAFAAGATARALAGNALGYPHGWHSLIAALIAKEAESRPESAPAALRLLAGGADLPGALAHHTAFRTDIGHHHPVNQDAGGVWSWQREDGTPVTLAVVADGVSAGAHSEDAAALTVELFRSEFEPHRHDDDLTVERAEALLSEAGMQAQQQVCALPMKSPEDASATTLVAVCLLGGTAVGIWCGDSRIYGVTPEGMRQLTRDHSWVNIMVESGQMTLEKAKADRRAHVIARWLGYSDPPRSDPGFDRFRCDLAPGDRLLLCSDGLYMYYDPPAGSEAELVETIMQHGDDLTGAVEAMVDTALARGGYDNITAVLVGVDQAAGG